MDGQLATTSILQRVNRPNSPPANAAAQNNANAIQSLARLSAAINGQNNASKAKGNKGNKGNASPTLSRPPSEETDLYTPIAPMSAAKCAVGTCALNGRLVVCGTLISLLHS